ncbi:MAG: sensor histidine kinase, partial [Chloroflexi bacterium]|nr:sensor histidine kinase [Chloroflexota bacterium]
MRHPGRDTPPPYAHDDLPALFNAVSGEQVREESTYQRSPLTLLTPLRVGVRRAVGEAVAGWLVLMGIADLLDPGAPHFLTRPSMHGLAALFTLLAWTWAVAWSGWRLRQMQGRGPWTRLLKGLVRIWLVGLVIGCICVCVADVVSAWPTATTNVRSGRAIAYILVFPVLLTFVRTFVRLAAAVRRWTRTRLRRQLMVSYLSVIMMTFVGLVGVGAIGAGVMVINHLPDPTSQARSIANTLQPGPGGNAMNPTRAQIVLQSLVANRLRLSDVGGSPLNLFIPWTAINRRTELVDTKGKLLAAATNDKVASGCVEQHPGEVLPRADRQRLINGALNGRVMSAKVPFASTCNGNGLSETAAAVPIYGASGRPIAVVLVRGAAIAPSWSQIFGTIILGFTAASVILIAFTVLPTLGLSSLAAMYFARGLTRRLGAVSHAASALAAGDLTQRVPVSAHNEIGQLAEDFNRMASHLEQIMGELRSARTQAEQALQSRQELVASVSHELRTPVAIVQAHLEALQNVHALSNRGESNIPAATMQALQSEMDRLATLVDDLFTLARAGTDAMQVHCAPIDVGSIVREVAALLRPLAQREGALTLTAETQPGLPLALADGERLRQILANLVRNAVRHTPEGGIIALGAAEEDQWLVLSVADTGEGIAPEHLPHIFDRFYRVDQARTRASGGAGLGLAIVKEFVVLMGGHVTVESNVNEGTCFH